LSRQEKSNEECIMSKLLLAALIGMLAIAVSPPAAALDTEAEYKAAKEQADAAYNVARQKCNAMSGNAKDVCVAEARGEQKKRRRKPRPRTSVTRSRATTPALQPPKPTMR
jgi:hypothetical protein